MFSLNTLDGRFPEGLVSKLTPRPDQIRDYRLLVSRQKSKDYSEVGTGKSLVSQLYILHKLVIEDKPALVIMPPALLPQYMDSFRGFTLGGKPIAMTRLHEDMRKREDLLKSWDESEWPPILGMSYQLFVKYAVWIESARHYRVIVADEAQAVSNVTTKAFQSLFRISAVKADLLLMTATPATTELISAYGHIRLCTPRAYTNLREFERRHVIYAPQQVGDKMVPQIVGYKDVEQLGERLMEGAVRRRQKEVLSLKELNIFDHKVVLSAKHSELYKQFLNEWMLEYGDEILLAKNKQALRQRALQLVTNINKYTEKPVDDTPFENLQEIMGKLDLKATKLLIFCNFKQTIVHLADRLKSFNPALVYGDSNIPANIKKLLEDSTCRVGILNFQSGGAGFNLQSVAHHIVVYEAIGSPGALQQVIGRAYRGGQEHPVVVWLFRYYRTMSTKLFKKGFERAQDIKVSMKDSECLLDFLVSSGSDADLRTELGITDEPPF